MLEPVNATNSANAADVLQRWCTTLGVLSIFVSDTASYFKNGTLAKLTNLLGIDHRYAVANSPWTNGSMESIMKEILRIFKVLLVDYRCSVNDWERFVPMVQWALNSIQRERLECSPLEAWFGRSPTSLMASLVRNHHFVVDIVPIKGHDLRLLISSLASKIDRMHKMVITTVTNVRAERRHRESRRNIPYFAVGEFVLVARVSQPKRSSKLISTWTGPWRVTDASKEHLYQV